MLKWVSVMHEENKKKHFQEVSNLPGIIPVEILRIGPSVEGDSFTDW